jgi:hypothetical protein
MTTSIISRTASKLMLWGFRAHFHHRITFDCIMHKLEVWRVFCVNTDMFITERVAVAWVKLGLFVLHMMQLIPSIGAMV